jgi:hypothetical protein
MPTCSLPGDIVHGGAVDVEADSISEAISKAESGDFTRVLDEDHKSLGFIFCGDETVVEEIA